MTITDVSCDVLVVRTRRRKETTNAISRFCVKPTPRYFAEARSSETSTDPLPLSLVPRLRTRVRG